MSARLTSFHTVDLFVKLRLSSVLVPGASVWSVTQVIFIEEPTFPDTIVDLCLHATIETYPIQRATTIVVSCTATLYCLRPIYDDIPTLDLISISTTIYPQFRVNNSGKCSKPRSFGDFRPKWSNPISLTAIHTHLREIMRMLSFYRSVTSGTMVSHVIQGPNPIQNLREREPIACQVIQRTFISPSPCPSSLFTYVAILVIFLPSSMKLINSPSSSLLLLFLLSPPSHLPGSIAALPRPYSPLPLHRILCTYPTGVVPLPSILINYYPTMNDYLPHV